MSVQWKDYMKQLQMVLRETNYIGPNDIPNIGLYMDQVTSFLDEHLESTKRFTDDKLLTKTMINNYTKNNLLPPPDKKKYSKDHMYLLAFIYYLKNFMSISDVKKIIAPMSSMFFGEKGEINLEDIYAEIFNIEQESSYSIAKDIMHKFLTSKKMFKDIKAEDEREYLQIFSFIAILSFDVYLKKNLIASIIDEVLDDENISNNNKKDEKK